MPQIQDLLNASIAVIAGYHDAKLPAAPIKASEKVSELLKKPDTEMTLGLTEIIEAAVTTNARDEARRPLMMYILHNVKLLKAFTESETPLESEALADLKKQLVEFVVNVQTLLLTSKLDVHTINYNNADVPLYGFIGDRLMGLIWSSWKLSCSGELLQQKIFPALRLPTTASRDDVADVISDAIDLHQTHLTFNVRESALAAREEELKTYETTLNQRAENLQIREALLSAPTKSRRGKAAPHPQQTMEKDATLPLVRLAAAAAAPKVSPMAPTKTASAGFWASFHSEKSGATKTTDTAEKKAVVNPHSPTTWY